MPLVIRPLTPQLRDAFFQYFDHDAFADNPRWKGCYCAFPHHDHSRPGWSTDAVAENRARAGALVCGGKMQGHMAFDGNKVAAWCQAAPRPSLLALNDLPDPTSDAAQVGAIICFVVAKPYRGQGIARTLLAAACDGFRARGFKFAEAFPRKDAKTEAANHFGPLSMYRAFGFTPHWEDEDSYCMRLAL